MPMEHEIAALKAKLTSSEDRVKELEASKVHANELFKGGWKNSPQVFTAGFTRIISDTLWMFVRPGILFCQHCCHAVGGGLSDTICLCLSF